jgi:hypothetical protein
MTEATQVETPAEAPTIGIVDLQNALKIIDAAAERGAFRGNELTAVGTVRDKINAFLDSLPKAEGEAEAAETTETAEPAQAAAEEPKAPAKRSRAKKG